MLKLTHAGLTLISGLVWLAVGAFLLPLGLKLLVESTYNQELSYPLVNFLKNFVGGAQTAALLLIVLGLFVGNMKGKHVLGKSVRRSVTRIQSFPNPTSITNIYSKGYYLLFGSMVLLGMSIKFFGLPNDIRGLVDVAIGAALINGASIYFKMAYAMRKLA